MTRPKFRLAASVLVPVLGACAGADASPPAADEPPEVSFPEASLPEASARPDRAVPDVTVVANDGNVVMVRDGIVAERFHGIVGLDGSTVVEVRNGLLLRRDLWAGRTTTKIGPVGGLVPIVTDLDGEYVVLGPPAGVVGDGMIAAPRGQTPVVVVAPDGEQFGVTLDGNFRPEAFSTEAAAGAPPWLYVLEYLPADAPTHYRVRILDMGTGELSWPVNLRLKTDTVDSEMAGISRDQIVATERGMLFTLYRGHHFEEGTDYAFVHMLAMGGGVWCLDVPAELELDHLPGAITVSPDEATLYVVSANGMLAEYSIDDVLDPDRDPVASRTVRAVAGGDDRPALSATPDEVVVAQGTTVSWLDAGDLAVVGTAPLGSPVDVVTATDDGEVVTANGARIEVVAIDGLPSASLSWPSNVGTPSGLVSPD